MLYNLLNPKTNKSHDCMIMARWFTEPHVLSLT